MLILGHPRTELLSRDAVHQVCPNCVGCVQACHGIWINAGRHCTKGWLCFAPGSVVHKTVRLKMNLMEARVWLQCDLLFHVLHHKVVIFCFVAFESARRQNELENAVRGIV